MPLNNLDKYNGCKVSEYRRTSGCVLVMKSTHPAYYSSQRLRQNLETSIPCLQGCIQPPTDSGSSLRLLQISYRPHTHHKEIIFRLFHRCTRYSLRYQSTLAFSHPRIADNHHNIYSPPCFTTH